MQAAFEALMLRLPQSLAYIAPECVDSMEHWHGL